jgi:hypothetical protein
MVLPQRTLDDLAERLARDPKLAPERHDELIVRNPIVDIHEYAVMLGGLEHDRQDPRKVTRVHLVVVGAPERHHWFDTPALETQAAIRDALDQFSRELYPTKGPPTQI